MKEKTEAMDPELIGLLQPGNLVTITMDKGPIHYFIYTVDTDAETVFMVNPDSQQGVKATFGQLDILYALEHLAVTVVK